MDVDGEATWVLLSRNTVRASTSSSIKEKNAIINTPTSYVDASNCARTRYALTLSTQALEEPLHHRQSAAYAFDERRVWLKHLILHNILLLLLSFLSSLLYMCVYVFPFLISKLFSSTLGLSSAHSQKSRKLECVRNSQRTEQSASTGVLMVGKRSAEERDIISKVFSSSLFAMLSGFFVLFFKPL